MPKQYCVALGDFDGVHLGHQQVINATVNNSENLIPVVYTFSHNSKGSPVITDNQTKSVLFKYHGIDHVIFDDFDNIKHLSPIEFVRDVLFNRLRAKTVVCGTDYRFGHKALGDINTLIDICKEYNINVIPVKHFTFTGKKLSSSQIRSLIKDGDIITATKMLGHGYFITGKVSHGKKLGRKNNTPTVNIEFMDNVVIPAYGVYISKTHIDGVVYNSISNVGIRPSVEHTEKPNVETNIFDFDGVLYDKEISVELIKLIRFEKKFDNKSLLYTQINADIETARQYFNGESNV